MAQTRFSREVESAEAVHQSVMAVLGHVCRDHAATPEAMKAALEQFSVAQLDASLRRAARQSDDPFAGL